MWREIGSNFWIDPRTVDTKSSELGFLKINLKEANSVLLSTGRSAISYALQNIKKIKKKEDLVALIPPFTCDTVLQPFLDEGILSFAYDINETLNINAERLKFFIESNNADVVLIHRYFGFDTAVGVEDVIKEYQNKGVIFIEDRTQNLFSTFESLPADYVVGSLRKWGPIPDGGFCSVVKGGSLYITQPEMYDRELVEKKLKAFSLKYEYMENGRGDKKILLQAYIDAENTLDSEDDFYKMSKESVAIWNYLDFIGMAAKRRQNYQYIFNYIRKLKDLNLLTGELQDGIVPLYLAITTSNRNQIQAHLREHAIYAPIVWPKPNFCPAISKTVQKIYDHVLCLPIDQRYDLDDMERMIKVLEKYRERRK